ncbi:MAG: S26 family signal peptidase [Burkholderiales bacterium]|nr:MAG: S26 family signal peptidase [Burkholderiales bacterium]
MGTEAIDLKEQTSGGSKRRRRDICLGLTLAGASLGMLSLLPSTPVFVWNHSGSVAIGLYSIAHRPPAKGDIIVIAPSGALRETLEAYGALPPSHLLLKQLAAASGDTVCRTHEAIAINGIRSAIARTATHDGLALPAWSGCRRLGENDVLVLTQHQGSFDSRYFGPISADQIVGVAHPIVTLSSEEAR